MPSRSRNATAWAGAALVMVLAVHVLLTLEVIRVSQRWLGGVAIAALLLVVVALHVAGLRRLAARRGRRNQ